MKIKLIFIILISIIFISQAALGNNYNEDFHKSDFMKLNEEPIPDFIWTPQWPNITTTVTFNASGSYDPDGYISEYSWDFTGDGLPDETGVEVKWSWDEEGYYPIRLSVCDDMLLCNGTSKNIRVVNSTPVADFSWSPYNPNVNQEVTIDASDSFDPDGLIATYYWDYDDDPDWDTAGGEEDKIITYSWESQGTYTITLKVEDSDLNYEVINKSISIIDNNPPFIPNNPTPTNGETDVPINIILNWKGGDPDPNDSVTYDIYFGSIPPLEKIESNQSETSFDPGELKNDLTYYWNIISWDNHNTKTIGPSWHFTTSSKIDETPPYVKIISPSSGLYLFNQKIMNLTTKIIAIGPIDIIIDAYDADSNINYIEYEFVRLPTFITGEIYDEPYQITLDTISAGRWFITITAYDNAGNEEKDNIEIWKFL